jgi:hypothetical protein
VKKNKKRQITRGLSSGGLRFSAEISYRYSRPNAKPPKRCVQWADDSTIFKRILSATFDSVKKEIEFELKKMTK